MQDTGILSRRNPRRNTSNHFREASALPASSRAASSASLVFPNNTVKVSSSRDFCFASPARPTLPNGDVTHSISTHRHARAVATANSRTAPLVNSRLTSAPSQVTAPSLPVDIVLVIIASSPFGTITRIVRQARGEKGSGTFSGRCWTIGALVSPCFLTCLSCGIDRKRFLTPFPPHIIPYYPYCS